MSFPTFVLRFSLDPSLQTSHMSFRCRYSLLSSILRSCDFFFSFPVSLPDTTCPNHFLRPNRSSGDRFSRVSAIRTHSKSLNIGTRHAQIPGPGMNPHVLMFWHHLLWVMDKPIFSELSMLLWKFPSLFVTLVHGIRGIDNEPNLARAGQRDTVFPGDRATLMLAGRVDDASCSVAGIDFTS
jgi:hypothetical protein